MDKLTAAQVARPLWDAASRSGPAPKVFELCSTGDGRWGCVRLHRPVSAVWTLGTVKDLVADPRTELIGVWTETVTPAGGQQLLVSGPGVPVALVGQIGCVPQVYEAVPGPVHVACLAALEPVPADDPLVLELALIAGES